MDDRIKRVEDRLDSVEVITGNHAARIDEVERKQRHVRETLVKQEGRIRDVEAASGDHSKKLVEHDGRIKRAEDVAYSARADVDQLQHAMAVNATAMIKAHQDAELRIQRKLGEQDGELAKQTGLLEGLKKTADDAAAARRDRQDAERHVRTMRFIALLAVIALVPLMSLLTTNTAVILGVPAAIAGAALVLITGKTPKALADKSSAPPSEK
jgi:chromosome segregation ATPase